VKRLGSILLLGLITLLWISTASATTLPPFTQSVGVVPNVLGSLPSGTLVATTGWINYHFGTPQKPNKNTGMLEENVYRDTHGFLFFVFQLKVTTGDIKTISSGDWSNGTMIDAEETKAGGSVKVTGVDRNGYGTIDLNFYLPLLLPSKESYAVILYTDSKGFVPGAIGLIDSGSSPSIPGFVAAPEPAAFSLLGIGLIGTAALRKKLLY